MHLKASIKFDRQLEGFAGRRETMGLVQPAPKKKQLVAALP